ncbi:hypothetical protein HYX14_03355 [Candidatus Woesearchaeota archaeon]|nr:hypothetical protein [Candidatus Woesearchaeota archaeon]
MNTKELIRLLQEADPAGETEVSVGNTPIFFVERQPAYYDGPQEVLIRDPEAKHYNVICAKYRQNGDKVVIELHSIEDYLSEYPDGSVDYSELSDNLKLEYIDRDNKMRKETKKMNDGIELDLFKTYVAQRAAQINPDVNIELSHLESLASDYFQQYLSTDDPLPEMQWRQEGNHRIGESHNERRHRQWDHEVTITYDGAVFAIRPTDPGKPEKKMPGGM